MSSQERCSRCEDARAEIAALEAEVKQAKGAIAKAEKNGDWAAVYMWLDNHKDAVVKKISDSNGKLECDNNQLETALEKAMVALTEIQDAVARPDAQNVDVELVRLIVNEAVANVVAVRSE